MRSKTTLKVNWSHQLIIVAFILAIPSYIEAKNNTNLLDSILNVIKKNEGKERLEVLEKYGALYENDLPLAKELEKEAIRQDNQLYMAIANQRLIYHFAVEGNRDSMKIYVNKTNKHLTLFLEEKYKSSNKEYKAKYSKIKAIVVATKATVYIDEGKYNLALNEIRKGLNDSIIGKADDFKNQAYSLIGIAYLYTKKPVEALANFRKSIAVNEKREATQGEEDKIKGGYRYYSGLEGSAIAHNLMKEYQKAIQVVDTLINRIEDEYQHIKLIQGENSNETFKYNFFKNRALCHSAQANIKMGNAVVAKQQLDEVGKFVSQISVEGQVHQDFEIYSTCLIEYYMLVGNYDKAMSLATSLADRVSLEYQPYSFMTVNLLLSEVLSAKGQNKKAYDLLYTLYNTNDSINAINFSNEFAEMETKHDLNEARFLINEANLKLKNTRMILALFVVFFLLSILVCYIVWRNKKILKDKNLQLYKQYKEIESRNKKITELQSIHKNILVNENQDEDTKSEIMEKLAQYLSETKIYLNSDITRENIALAIGTNRQYLIEAIKDKTGKTFNEFIYSYRLQFAYELLINNREQTISEILQESGFHSRATFYNAFKDAYGMTPSELRNILD